MIKRINVSANKKLDKKSLEQDQGFSQYKIMV